MMIRSATPTPISSSDPSARLVAALELFFWDYDKPAAQSALAFMDETGLALIGRLFVHYSKIDDGQQVLRMYRVVGCQCFERVLSPTRSQNEVDPNVPAAI